MAELLSFENLGTLLMLIFLQAVLGFDNLLYISIESKRVPVEKQQMVRRVGIGMAIVLRIVLLFVVVQAIASFQKPFMDLHWTGIFEAGFTIHALIVLAGGVFIIYTAIKEIWHMLSIEDIEAGAHGDKEQRSVGSAIMWIVIMNLVFSFDSILSAIALASDKVPSGKLKEDGTEIMTTVIQTDGMIVMTIAIVAGGIMMMVLADKVSDFLQKNRMYEVLGLFILFLVGIMLVSEGGHLAHLIIAGHPIEAMPKSTFYFVLVVLVIVDVAQGRYQRKLNLERSRKA